jgi:hypothetical protein
MENTSEFGKGFIYNLILFAKHFERKTIHEDEYGLWFNGAGDHFYELEIPESLRETEIGKLALDLQKRALNFRLTRPVTREKFDLFFEDLEILCRNIDKEVFKIDSVKADWN